MTVVFLRMATCLSCFVLFHQTAVICTPPVILHSSKGPLSPWLCNSRYPFSYMTSPSKKIKQSLHRPGQALRFPGGEDPTFHNNSTWMWQGFQPYAPAAFTSQEIFLVLISVRGWVVRREGLCQWKIPVIPLGIEPATFRLVASTNCTIACRPSPSTLL